MKGVVPILSACAPALSAAGCGGLEFEKPRTFSEYGNSEFLVPYKQLTDGDPHWFAYYDKLETDPSGRYVLSMRSNFKGGTPTKSDRIEIGTVDTRDNRR